MFRYLLIQHVSNTSATIYAHQSLSRSMPMRALQTQWRAPVQKTLAPPCEPVSPLGSLSSMKSEDPGLGCVVLLRNSLGFYGGPQNRIDNHTCLMTLWQCTWPVYIDILRIFHPNYLCTTSCSVG